MKYTPEQKRAVESTAHDTVVTAGAGAGKTRVLVDRIVYILEAGLAHVDEIVAITYTIKAATEIRERLRRELKSKPALKRELERLGISYIGTIHSFCLRILKENPVYARLDPEVEVVEEHRATAMISQSLREGVLDNLEDAMVYSLIEQMGLDVLCEELQKTFHTMRNQGLVPHEDIKGELLAGERAISLLLCEGFRIYEEKKMRLGIIDFEDILQKTKALLDGYPEVAKHYNEKLKFIMVDEYQDLNFVQDYILRKLGEVPNLFVVGDKKQSIFGFRGARVELFEQLQEDLNLRGQAINLTTNFRSSKPIIDFVNKCFGDVMDRYEDISFPTWLKPDAENAGVKGVNFLLPASQGNMAERRGLEGKIIAQKIGELLSDGCEVYDPNSKGYRIATYGDFCILLRRRTYLWAYTEALEESEIPYSVAVGQDLTQSFGVKLLMMALDTVALGDESALYCVLTGLFDLKNVELADFVARYGSLRVGIEDDGFYDMPFDFIRKWRSARDTRTLKGLLDMIVEDSNLIERLCHEEILDLMKFSDLIVQADEEGESLEEFLEEMRDFGKEQEPPGFGLETENVVKIVTIHSSKGLEFPIVFVADVSSQLPRSTSKILFEPTIGIGLKGCGERWDSVKKALKMRELQEAQRLLYVATTRARDMLYISGEDVKTKRQNFLQWLRPQIDPTVHAIENMHH